MPPSLPLTSTPFVLRVPCTPRYKTTGGIATNSVNLIRSTDTGIYDHINFHDPICVVIHPAGKWVYVLSQGRPSDVSGARGYGVINLFERAADGGLSYKGAAAKMEAGDQDMAGIHQSSQKKAQPANDGLAMTSDGAFLYCTGILSDGLSQYVSLPRRRDEGGGMGRVGGEQGEVWGKLWWGHRQKGRVLFLATGTPLCALTRPLLPPCVLLCSMLSSDFRSTLPRER